MKCGIYDVNLSLNRLLRAEVKGGIQKKKKKIEKRKQMQTVKD
jgi:hypothetical protein